MVTLRRVKLPECLSDASASSVFVVPLEAIGVSCVASAPLDINIAVLRGLDPARARRTIDSGAGLRAGSARRCLCRRAGVCCRRPPPLLGLPLTSILLGRAGHACSVGHGPSSRLPRLIDLPIVHDPSQQRKGTDVIGHPRCSAVVQINLVSDCGTRARCARLVTSGYGHLSAGLRVNWRPPAFGLLAVGSMRADRCKTVSESNDCPAHALCRPGSDGIHVRQECRENNRLEPTSAEIRCGSGTLPDPGIFTCRLGPEG